jgi:hypothetical protein
MYLVHQAPRVGVASRILAPGVKASSWEEFVAQDLP